MIGKRPVTLALVGVTAVALAACSPAAVEPDHDAAFSAVAEELEARTTGSARWATAHAQSLEAFVEAYPTVLVGPVTIATDISAAGEVKGEGPPTLTAYSVQVTAVLSGSGILPGDLVTVHQAGGMFQGIAYQHENDPMIRVGSSYLFFLGGAGDSAWAGPPYGRFRVDDDGRLAPVDPVWSYLGAVKELSGLTVEEAARRVASAKSSS